MTPRLLVSALLATTAASLATHAYGQPVLRAGAWESKMDNGTVHRICERTDKVMNKETLDKMMAMVGAKCTAMDVHFAGPVATFSDTCAIAGGQLTTNSTITSLGPDAYSTRSHSHLAGGTMKIPDMDMTQVSHRVGACQPGDRVSPF